MVELKKNGDIIVDGEQVGILEWNENVIVDIMVDSDIRGQGVGTEAVSQLLTIMRSEGYEEVRTTAVVSGAMETVLRRNGFEYVEVRSPMPDERRNFVESSSSVDIPEIQNEWRKEL